MDRGLLRLGASLGFLALLPIIGPVSAQVTNIQSQGNLAVTHKVGCVSLDKLKTVYTPADLYPGVAKCLDAERYEDAFGLFALAGVYGRFDTYRVSDQTAHQAISVLQMGLFDDRSKSANERFMTAAKGIMVKPAAREKFCAKLERIGPPSYFPSYMIQHGMGSFTGSDGGNGLKANFESKAAFKRAMDTYIGCKVSY